VGSEKSKVKSGRWKGKVKYKVQSGKYNVKSKN
jgi:hypothetical protein